MSIHPMLLIGGADDESMVLEKSTKEGRCYIQCSVRSQTIEAEDGDYFEAFTKIRLQLEGLHLIPFCYGASLNVFPSGMCRDMGGGSVAYRLTLGATTNRNDLVNIFDSGHDVIPASVANQKAFFENWKQSIRK